MDARIERRVRAARGVERQRAGRQRRAEQGLRLEQADERVRGRELRAVEQREPFLRPKRERLEARCGERFGRRQDPIVEHGLAHADHRGRHMGERREIARGADRALRRNHRRHAAIEHRRDAVDASRGRTPEAPCARLPSFSAIISRVTGTGVASPTPAACDRTMLR